MLVFGTRPEVIKLAPVAHRLRAAHPECRVTLLSTGQHRDMLDSACAALDLKPDHALAVMQPGQHPTELLGRLLIGLRGAIAQFRPDVIVVQGDTLSVTAGAVAGYLDQVRVAHVEAGLRTADDHFVPTPAARDNLLRENTPAESIHVTGNTVIDALYWMRQRVATRAPRPELAARAPRMILVTAHRRESFGAPFRDLCHALRRIAERFDDVELIYPVHLNPNVRAPVQEILAAAPRVRLIEPVDYADLVTLLDRATLVLTDSGGLQEEAPALGKPVLVLREKTERPEAVAAGVARLVGTDPDAIVAAATELLTDPAAYARMARGASPYGDGRAAARICEILVHGRATLPPFSPPGQAD